MGGDLVTSRSAILMAVIFTGSWKKFRHIFSFCCSVANLSCSQVSWCLPATTVSYMKKRKIAFIFNPLISLRKTVWIWKAMSWHFGYVWLILSDWSLTALTNLVWALCSGVWYFNSEITFWKQSCIPLHCPDQLNWSQFILYCYYQRRFQGFGWPCGNWERERCTLKPATDLHSCKWSMVPTPFYQVFSLLQVECLLTTV